MAFNKLKNHKNEGFTLVELLIVIVVIAILAAITIIAYNGVTQKARTSQAVSAANNVQQIAEIVNTASGHYPQDTNDFTVSCLPTKLPASIVLETSETPTTAGTLASGITGFTGLDSASADSQHVGYLATTGNSSAPSSTNPATGGVIYHWDYTAGNMTSSLNYAGSATSSSIVFPLTSSSASFSTCN